MRRASAAGDEQAGAPHDEAIGDLLIATMTPVALEVALTVQNELASRIRRAAPGRRGAGRDAAGFVLAAVEVAPRSGLIRCGAER